jgi:autotransporter adhesin
MGGDVAIGSGAGAGSAGTASVDTDNVYLGTQAGAGVANGGHNVAIGLNAGSGRGNDSDENIAIGTAAGSGQTGRGNISIGIGAASGSNTSNESTTIGYNANASQSYAVAVGSNASANGANATAFGYNSTAAGGNSLALGASAQARYGGSIALGSGSIADQTLDHLSDPAFLTGQQANYTLSVGAAPSGGNPGIVRRISNVAGGSLDNDAVNVAQLKNLEQGVQDIVGAYASINPATGQLQYKRPDGQGGSYDTLDDYLDALTTGNGTPQPAPTGAVMYDSGPNHGHITLDGDGSGGGTLIYNFSV